jgi:hypothetical protein
MGVQAIGFDKAIRKLSGVDKRLAAEVKQKAIQAEARALAGKARAAAGLRIQRLAATTVRTETTASGADIHGGGGSGPAGAVFKGAEFGARGVRRTSYVRRANRGRGRPGVVRRRTTRQFPPYLGRHGYFYWPTLRAGIKGIQRRIQQAIERELGRG